MCSSFYYLFLKKENLSFFTSERLQIAFTTTRSAISLNLGIYWVRTNMPAPITAIRGRTEFESAMLTPMLSAIQVLKIEIVVYSGTVNIVDRSWWLTFVLSNIYEP